MIPGSNAVRQRHGYTELVAASAASPFIRHEIPDALADVWWQAGAAVAVRRIRHRGGLSIVVLGPEGGVSDVVAALPGIMESLARGGGRGQTFSVTVPQHLESLLHKDFRILGGGDWEWFHTTAPPPERAGDEAVVSLDDVARHDEVVEFLARHSPTADTPPGRGERWFAIESAPGRLAAVTAYGRTATGAPHLSSVAVDERLRGHGLGRRIVSVVTRRAVTECGVCTLGMYSDNAVGRALYLSLGYDNPYQWASRAVVINV
jgi:GNAT superfamily N-acetyltransferase